MHVVEDVGYPATTVIHVVDLGVPLYGHPGHGGWKGLGSASAAATAETGPCVTLIWKQKGTVCEGWPIGLPDKTRRDSIDSSSIINRVRKSKVGSCTT